MNNLKLGPQGRWVNGFHYSQFLNKLSQRVTSSAEPRQLPNSVSGISACRHLVAHYTLHYLLRRTAIRGINQMQVAKSFRDLEVTRIPRFMDL
jgi:hypothetical protein